ncbi:hypothetical protein TrLO_g13828 [Triparma laevis f. longispina]|uniref:Uncharacterized protein n=1 Tax=Triparma laevis f. longispina TaxID=1714387 RepID=A0A9W7AGV5_9STRA|nr:hypothetical protein TrLO_g13828 [Triparma laevis f. longispina]
MGNGQSASNNPRSVCNQYYLQLSECKAHLSPPLKLTDRYPINAKDVCEEAEYALKRCLAHAIDPKAAATLYDKEANRADRVAANKKIVPKLKPYLWKSD